MTDLRLIDRDLGIVEFLEQYPYADGPLPQVVSQFINSLSVPGPLLMVTLSTAGNDLPRVVTRGEFSYAAGRAALTLWTASPDSQFGVRAPRAVVVDEIDSEFL